ncbi:MAG: NTP transferase domain-containing protein [Firmicutes bacterium]|nr:NTP transferase domain-containing protein [Bacillota bacterium]
MAYAVVMAGGNGSRLWPRVRISSPKPLMVLDGKTLLEKTLERANALVGPENVFVTTNESLLETITEIVSSPLTGKVYTEPGVKDTGPAMGLMAARIAAGEPDAVIAFLPADHVILDEAEFNRVLQAALKAGENVDGLVVIGITANEPCTSYGYIKRGKELYVEDGYPVYKVERFREKPGAHRAQRYLEQGGYFWNSGIVVGRAGTIVDLLRKYNPKLRPGLEKIMASLGQPEEADVIRELYTEFERISFDYAVLEKAANIYMVVGDFGWQDIGSWSSFAKVSSTDAAGNAFSGRAAAIDSVNCLVSAPGKLAALIGVEDLIVIDTDDVLFICKKDRDQEVKALLNYIRESGWDEYL